LALIVKTKAKSYLGKIAGIFQKAIGVWLISGLFYHPKRPQTGIQIPQQLGNNYKTSKPE
jgi:hypothetical protein